VAARGACAVPAVGLLYSASPNGMAFFVTAFRNGLKEDGLVRFLAGGDITSPRLRSLREPAAVLL
jgi:hypothetical protein